MMNADPTDTHTLECPACSSTDLTPCTATRRHAELGRWVILRCGRCGTGRIVTAATDAEVHSTNNSLYDDDDRYGQRVHGEAFQRRNLDDATWILRRIGQSSTQPPKRFLDIGCSAGGMMAAFASSGYDVHGIEPSGAVHQAPAELAPKIQHCWFGDEALQEPFDLVTAFHVLEHVPCPEAFLAHCHESLARRGVLVIEVPDFEFALRRLDDDQAEALCQISPNYHINQFTALGLELLLRRTGFTVLRQDRIATYVRKAWRADASPVAVEAIGGAAGPVPDAAPPPARSLRSGIGHAVWGHRFLRMRIRHALAHTLGLGRYLRIFARTDDRVG